MPNDFNFANSYANAPSRQNTVWDYLASIDPSIVNRYNTYNDPFSFGDINKKLDEIFNTEKSNINKNVADDIAMSQENVLGNLTSQGITGGSVVTDALSSTAGNINKEKYNALGNLDIAKNKAIMDAMNQENKRKLLQTELATNVDKSNLNALFQKGGMLANYDTQWRQGDLAEANQPGILSDIFSGIGDISSILPALLEYIGSSSGVGAATASAMIPAVAGSDIRLKENISLVGNKNGINIYEFNFKTEPNIKFRGVIADEVEKIIPDAVSTVLGVKCVNYSLIGIPFERV